MVIERVHQRPAGPADYAPPRRVSPADYSRLSEDLPGRYEYHNGLMYPRYYPPGSQRAMAGGTAGHAQLIVSLLTALRVHLGARGPCRLYPSDMRLKADASVYFPDAFVVCGQTQPDQRQMDDAVLICEVRSQSTAEFDRGDKFETYQRLPSLREYVILDNRRPQVTLFRMADGGGWTYLSYTAGMTFTLTSVGLELSVDSLYEGLTLDPDPTSGANRRD